VRDPRRARPQRRVYGAFGPRAVNCHVALAARERLEAFIRIRARTKVASIIKNDWMKQLEAVTDLT
jgi:hypothetical protein